MGATGKQTDVQQTQIDASARTTSAQHPWEEERVQPPVFSREEQSRAPPEPMIEPGRSLPRSRAPTPSPPPSSNVFTPKQQQPVLGDFLRKRPEPTRDEESPPVYGSAKLNKPSRNPFQTATERLQFDRATGRARENGYDDDGYGSSARGRSGNHHGNGRGPGPGNYHPINHNLLFGGNINDGDIPMNPSVNKPFVLPTGEGKNDEKPSRTNGARWVRILQCLNGSVLIKNELTRDGWPLLHRIFSKQSPSAEPEEDIDPRLKSCDPELIAKIEMEIVDNGDPITFDDIGRRDATSTGLRFAKKCVNELVIWPMARPDIFTGLRALPKGALSATTLKSHRIQISAWIACTRTTPVWTPWNREDADRESYREPVWRHIFQYLCEFADEQMAVRHLHRRDRLTVDAAKVLSCEVVSSWRDGAQTLTNCRYSSSEENEASRRMKTEFLVQLDGAGTKAKDVILVVGTFLVLEAMGTVSANTEIKRDTFAGATNRPQELDEAARRRFVKRLYIPLPSSEARLEMINRLLRNNRHNLTDENKTFVAEATKACETPDRTATDAIPFTPATNASLGYSGADVRALCTEAAMGPIRTCEDIRTMDADAVRPISLEDFTAALRGTWNFTVSGTTNSGASRLRATKASKAPRERHPPTREVDDVILVFHGRECLMALVPLDVGARLGLRSAAYVQLE
ncbi:hypothetical protein PybrP1_001653, partial [[Pythium] brassicae (nom. inval.)]